MNRLFETSRGPLVAPSILAADFARMGEECASVIRAGADLLHLDVMDGHFVPNLTLGPDMCRSINNACPDAFLDVHLMVDDPLAFAEAFRDAGAHHLTIHVESIGVTDPVEAAATIRGLGMSAGLAINPPTPVEDAAPYLDAFDLILVMSVNPGRSGQAFIEHALDKTANLRSMLGPDKRIQMDGGISASNANAVLEAGCDVLVAGSGVFKHDESERASVIRKIRGE